MRIIQVYENNDFLKFLHFSMEVSG